MKMRRVRLVAILCVLVIALAWQMLAGIFSAWATVKEQPLKVGFIMVGPVNDSGWNSAHDRGRRFLDNALERKVQTTVVENVPENAEAERVLEKMIAQGNRLIFTTSYGYLEPALRAAARHPEVIFVQCQRSAPASAKNVGNYFANQFESMYVVGFVAGRMSKKGKLGYVAGHPVPTILASLNAFALGALRANPRAKVSVIWTNSWYDPSTEAEATKGLIDSGDDVVAAHVDSAVTTARTAEKNGAYSAGCNSELNEPVPKGWLTGQCWNWGPLYVKIAESVRDHTWKPGSHCYGMKDGYVDISQFGAAVPDAVRKQASSIKRQIEDGSLVIFKGPIKDRDGKLRVKAGEVLDAKGLADLNWVVEGVDGALPK